MIYVIESASIFYNEVGERCLGMLIKIGYTSENNKENRLNSYITHDPTHRVIRTIDNGTAIHEAKLHEKFKKYRFSSDNYSGKEWFYWKQEIIDFMMSATLETLDKLPLPDYFLEKLNDKVLYRVLYFLSDYQVTKNSLRKELIENYIFDENKIIEYVLQKYSVNILEDQELNSVYNEYYNNQGTFERLKYLCLCDSEIREKLMNLLPETEASVKYVKQLGSEKCKALGYNVTKIKNFLSVTTTDFTDIGNIVKQKIVVGKKYSRSEIKKILQSIYKDQGYRGNAKASDIEKWFEVRAGNFIINGQKTNGFEILSMK